MTAAESSLREGRPEEALTQLKEEVRQDPSNPEKRVFLFQLLALLGQWERALNQLAVAGELDASNLAMVQTYRTALHCEVFRREVFAGERTPHLMGEPEQWLALMVEALRLTATQQDQASQSVREEAFEAAPATAGDVDGQPFAWIADADPQLGPIIEAIINGHYYWIPFHQIRILELEPPTDLRDLVWTPTQFTWINGGQSPGLIPTRYPESHSSSDPLIRMARKTEWLERNAGLYVGLGQRILVTDVSEHPLLDTRQIQLEPQEAGSG